MRKMRQESTFLKYFWAFSVLVIVLCLVMTLFQSFYTNYLFSLEIQESGNNIFTLLIHAQNALLKQLDNVITSLRSSTQYQSFGQYYADNEINQQIGVLEQMNQLLLSMEDLENICLYFPDHNITVSTNQTVSSVSLYHDPEFLSYLSQQGRASQTTYVRTVNYINLKQPTKVISIVRALPLEPYLNIRAFLIVDINYASMMQSFEPLMASNGSSLLLFNESNELISALGHSYDLDKLLPNGPLHSTGISFTKKELDGDTLFVYATSAETPAWRYVYVQNYTMISKIMPQIHSTLFFISLLLISIGLFYAWKASKRLYHPIHQISLQIGSPETNIFDRIELMIQENERLNTSLQDNIITGRNRQLFHQLLCNFGISDSSRDPQPVLPSGVEYAFYLIRTATDCEALSMTNVDALIQPFHMSVLTKLFTAPNEIALLISSERFDIDRIHASAQAIWNIVSDENGSVGVSKPFTHIDDFAVAYQQSREALDMQLVYGSGSVVCFLDIRNKPTPDYPYYLENAILRSFHNGDIEQVNEDLNQYAQYLICNEIHPRVVRDFYTHLYCSFQRMVMDTPAASAIMLTYSHQEMLALSTIQEITEFLQNLLSLLLDESSTPAEDAIDSPLVDEICLFIDSHLEDLPTINQIAAEFHVGTTKLRTEFSKAKGMTIKNYINQQKMIVGRRLLEEGELRIQDIATLLGFQHTQSFSLFFRNYQGVSPREYQCASRLRKQNDANGIKPLDLPYHTDF